MAGTIEQRIAQTGRNGINNPTIICDILLIYIGYSFVAVFFGALVGQCGAKWGNFGVFLVVFFDRSEVRKRGSKTAVLGGWVLCLIVLNAFDLVSRQCPMA